MSRSCDGQYDVYRQTPRKARKEHRCNACWRDGAIQPGHAYTVVATVYEGAAHTIKRCARCQALHDHLKELCSEDNERWPDERLNCGESYESEWGDVPEWIAAMAFWLPGEPLPTPTTHPEVEES